MLVSQRAHTEVLSVKRDGPQRSEPLLPDAGLPIAGTMTERLTRQLTLALEQADVSDLALRAILTDAIQMLLGLPENRPGDNAAHPSPCLSGQGLVKWRFGRVERYIREHLHRNITLPELALAAGLSRMHFAKQFKVAMGLRPHEYVLGKRIELAKSLMLNPDVPLVDVAMSAGFQSQSHFTTVFRRLVGETPHRWRCRRTEVSKSAVPDGVLPFSSRAHP
ncbi:AraC family transcriptional regulator (plasmid) [Microvirga terrae]|uniref:AraC family transcriptional regulator n=1 Tax=Microvirga terrae TaxID=2740529 RepID=A0ABY5S2K1_9HYPH|nr:AraC family transcriptional regulator [Microvirga terrae]UVF22632.1 AraC family transcriptional regulator [Microvirga terrae]